MALDRSPVLFVMAPGGLTRHFPEHLGTAFLRAVLRREGIASRQYLPDGNPSLRGFAEFLRKSRPRVLGFTVYEANLKVSRAMVQAARESLPGSVILVGGPNATFTPVETLELVGADACLRGAGEGTIVPLVGRILGADPASVRLEDLLADLPSLVMRTPDGVRHTRCGDLSSFPAAHFRTLDDIPSPFQDGLVSNPEVGYVTARGCNQNCTYCSFAAVSGRRVAFHGEARVLDDLEALEALAARTPGRRRELNILDDAFTLVPDRARRICEGILERGIRLRMTCETRGDRVTPDLLRLMRRAGFTDIAFGLESAVPRVLRRIGKVRAPDAVDDSGWLAEREYLARFRDAVEGARRCGLNVTVSVIGGLPEETADDFRATLRFVSSLEVPAYVHNVLGLFPGTPLHERRRAFGLKAFRDPRTLTWRTVHAYPAHEVAPLRHSSVHRSKWDEARVLSDALCGRSGGLETAGGAPWAAVIHGGPKSRRVAAWLRRTLAIGGSVVVFVRTGAEAARWNAFLTRSRVPFGDLSCLVPDGSAPGTSFDVRGDLGRHRVRLVSTCSPRGARVPVRVNADGDCAISVWLASSPDARVRRLGCWECPLIGPGLQVGDVCGAASAAPRCERPRVLHLDARGKVRACWHGLVIGTADGDSAAGGPVPRRSRAASRCPLASPRGMDDDSRSRLWDLDLASQLGWSFPPGASYARTKTATAERSKS